ncbi:hypothetical protein PT974_11406 [Cladobotryum mycophilum]|uniref:Aminotransferase n=1 Tax=Cladobotryum mycophilum TaxID=491253 RepID=A0ABR0S546_9HYPO
MSQQLDPAVKAIISDPEFEITTTMCYSAGFPSNPNHPALRPPISYYYVLQYSIDRMRVAAKNLFWTAVVNNLGKGDRLVTLAKVIESHMINTHKQLAQDPEKSFIVRLGFKEDASLSFRSAEMPVKKKTLYFPLALPPIPVSVDLADSRRSVIYFSPEPTKPSLFTKHKTSSRNEYNILWEKCGFDDGKTSFADADVLMYNERDEVMGTLSATVYFQRDGQYVTPSSDDGCKLSVTRRWALENGVAKEAVIPVDSVQDGRVVWISTGVIGFHQAIIRTKKE